MDCGCGTRSSRWRCAARRQTTSRRRRRSPTACPISRPRRAALPRVQVIVALGRDRVRRVPAAAEDTGVMVRPRPQFAHGSRASLAERHDAARLLSPEPSEHEHRHADAIDDRHRVCRRGAAGGGERYVVPGVKPGHEPTTPFAIRSCLCGRARRAPRRRNSHLDPRARSSADAARGPRISRTRSRHSTERRRSAGAEASARNARREPPAQSWPRRGRMPRRSMRRIA